jgi:hypothetical protein
MYIIRVDCRVGIVAKRGFRCWVLQWSYSLWAPISRLYL